MDGTLPATLLCSAIATEVASLACARLRLASGSKIASVDGSGHEGGCGAIGATSSPIGEGPLASLLLVVVESRSRFIGCRFCCRRGDSAAKNHGKQEQF